MKRLLLAVAFTLFASATVAIADDMPGSPMHHNIGLGFHNTEAPVGVRWWFSGQKVGLDLGFGFLSVPATSDGYPDERLMSWAIDAGVPFVMHSWERVHVLFRPGLLYQSEEFTTSGGLPAPFTTETATAFTISGEIEGEIFLADNVSVSASHGLAFQSVDSGIPGTDSQTTFGTFGRNFTNVGFHLYFLGGGQ